MACCEEDVNRFFDLVDQKKALFIERLSHAVSIPSISSELDLHLKDIIKMMEYAKSEIERLGGTCTLVPNPDGTDDKPLPPILTGDFGSDPEKKTVCLYGHLDVQPAAKEDGWLSDPFVLTERDEKLFGRGSTDDKGPALSWLWAIECFQELGISIPVNIKLMYEGMEEFGSEGIFTFIQKEATEPGKFLSDVDFFCISDSYWLGKNKPCLTYGLRGIAYFCVSVKGCGQDLHSGIYGGTVHEAMTDLIQLMSTLVDSPTGKILIDGVMDDVKPLTEEEDALYDPIDFDMDDFKRDCTVDTVGNKLLHETKKPLLQSNWRYPSLSLHGIEGAFSSPGMKTVIPAKVTGKFSIRLVPDQDSARIEKVVREHLEREFAKLGSPNQLDISMAGGAKAWLSSPQHPNYTAAAAAIKRVFSGAEPDYTRGGGSIPLTTALEDSTGVNVLLLPIGASDDMAHSQNEKYNISNMMNGVKVLGLYLQELGNIKGPKPSSCRCIPLTQGELMVPGAFLKGFRCKCEM